MNSYVGHVFSGRYEVLELIGEGGMARVYRCLDRRLSRTVVLKVLKDDLLRNDELRQRFAREASSVARLAHSNIIRVHDVDEEDGVPFIVMEFYPSQDLKSILRKVGKLSPRRAVEIASAILDALDYAHGQGIIHRDLKPHNILVTDRNEVKITDFGIAKALASDSLTRTGTMMGTAHYMSPEQAQGLGVTPATDLYSLGVMLFEMLTGRLPFEGDNPVTVGLRHVQEAPPTLASFGVKLPEALEDVLSTALRKNPAERYRDALTFQRALLRAVREHRPTSPSPSPASPPQARAASAGPSPLPPTFADRPIDDTVAQPGALAPRASDKSASHRALPGLPAWSLADSGEFRAAPPTPPSPIEPPTTPVRAAFLLTLATVVAMLVLYAGYRVYTGSQQIRVPRVLHLSGDEARTQVERDGLIFTVKEPVFSDEPPGTVLEQTPAPGSVVAQNSRVMVVISKGRYTVPVPVLTGLDRLAATQAAQAVGLALRWGEAYSDTVPLGHVVTQDPPAGTAVDPKTPVTVVISRGVVQVVVPNLVGEPQSTAADLATKAGFKLTTVTQKSSASAPKGTILEQSPAAGLKVSRGIVVQVVVSSGPESRPVPNLQGLTVADARRTARQQGFQLAIAATHTPDDAHVVEQDPAAGTLLPQGSSIQVTSDAQLAPTPERSGDAGDQVLVPNVVHLGLDDARKALEECGLRVGQASQEESDEPVGTVIRQTPQEGTNVARGSNVDLVIAVKRRVSSP